MLKHRTDDPALRAAHIAEVVERDVYAATHSGTEAAIAFVEMCNVVASEFAGKDPPEQPLYPFCPSCGESACVTDDPTRGTLYYCLACCLSFS